MLGKFRQLVTALDSHTISTVRASLEDPGFYIFRGVIEPETIEHIRKFWNNHVCPGPTDYDGYYKDGVTYGAQNSTHIWVQKAVHFNFFWNQPEDPVTHTLAQLALTLRNAVMEKEPDWGLDPARTPRAPRLNYQYLFMYRIICDFPGSRALHPHADRANVIDDSVGIQIPLTDYGIHYLRGGLEFETTRKEHVVFDAPPIALATGDVLIWTNTHRHAVYATEGNWNNPYCGRWRMMVKTQEIFDHPKGKVGPRSKLGVYVRRSLVRSVGLRNTIWFLGWTKENMRGGFRATDKPLGAA